MYLKIKKLYVQSDMATLPKFGNNSTVMISNNGHIYCWKILSVQAQTHTNRHNNNIPTSLRIMSGSAGRFAGRVIDDGSYCSFNMKLRSYCFLPSGFSGDH